MDINNGHNISYPIIKKVKYYVSIKHAVHMHVQHALIYVDHSLPPIQISEN